MILPSAQQQQQQQSEQQHNQQAQQQQMGQQQPFVSGMPPHSLMQPHTPVSQHSNLHPNLKLVHEPFVSSKSLVNDIFSQYIPLYLVLVVFLNCMWIYINVIFL